MAAASGDFCSGCAAATGSGCTACDGIGHEQCDEADVGAGADALQHHAADIDGRCDRALLQRFVARLVETGFDEIVKAEQGTRRIAGADQQAVAR